MEDEVYLFRCKLSGFMDGAGWVTKCLVKAVDIYDEHTKPILNADRGDDICVHGSRSITYRRTS
jgi:hypothetical protein